MAFGIEGRLGPSDSHPYHWSGSQPKSLSLVSRLKSAALELAKPRKIQGRFEAQKRKEKKTVEKKGR